MSQDKKIFFTKNNAQASLARIAAMNLNGFSKLIWSALNFDPFYRESDDPVYRSKMSDRELSIYNSVEKLRVEIQNRGLNPMLKEFGIKNEKDVTTVLGLLSHDWGYYRAATIVLREIYPHVFSSALTGMDLAYSEGITNRQIQNAIEVFETLKEIDQGLKDVKGDFLLPTPYVGGRSFGFVAKQTGDRFYRGIALSDTLHEKIMDLLHYDKAHDNRFGISMGILKRYFTQPILPQFDQAFSMGQVFHQQLHYAVDVTGYDISPMALVICMNSMRTFSLILHPYQVSQYMRFSERASFESNIDLKDFESGSSKKELAA